MRWLTCELYTGVSCDHLALRYAKYVQRAKREGDWGTEIARYGEDQGSLKGAN